MPLKKITAKDKIIHRLIENGEVDNFWCIDNRITTRLGAFIFVLKQQGYEFTEGFIDGTKNFRYTLTKLPEPKQLELV